MKDYEGLRNLFFKEKIKKHSRMEEIVRVKELLENLKNKRKSSYVMALRKFRGMRK